LTESHPESGAVSTEAAAPVATSAASIVGMWIASLSFCIWVLAVMLLFGQKSDAFPQLRGIDKFVLILVDLGSLAVGVLTSWILIVRKAWAAGASPWRIGAIAIAGAAIGAAVLLFCGLGILFAGVGIGPCG
jgi:hypothetical protein